MPFWPLCRKSKASDHMNMLAELKKFSNPATTAAVLNNVSYRSHRLGTLSQYIISLAKFKRIETEGSLKEKFKNCPNP